MWKGRRLVLIGSMTAAVAAIGLGVAVGAESKTVESVEDIAQIKVRAISDILEKIREIRAEARNSRRMAFLGCVNERFNVVQGLKRIATYSQSNLEKAMSRHDRILVQQETKTITEAAYKAEDAWSQVKSCEKEEDDVVGLRTDEIEVNIDDEIMSIKDPTGEGMPGTGGGGPRIPNPFDGGTTLPTDGGSPGGGGIPSDYIPPPVSPFR